MTSVLVDTNIFIDVFGRETPFKLWSSKTILAFKPQAQFILTPIVWSEPAEMSVRLEPAPESFPAGLTPTADPRPPKHV